MSHVACHCEGTELLGQAHSRGDLVLETTQSSQEDGELGVARLWLPGKRQLQKQGWNSDRVAPRGQEKDLR